MTNRRDLIRTGALWTMGALVLPYEEILDRLNWTRTLFPSAEIGRQRISSIQDLFLRLNMFHKYTIRRLRP